MRLAVAVLAVSVGLAGVAEARMHAPYRGHRIVPAASAPLDSFTQPAGAYSFRKLRTAYTGNAVRLRRATGGEQDIGFAGFVPGLGSPLDVAAANTFCAATSCFLTTWYDQSGNSRHWLQATAAAQPQLIFNCTGALPCARSLGTGSKMVAAGSVTAALPISLSAVAHRNVLSATQCFLVSTIDNYGNQIFIDANNSRWVLWDGSAFVPPASTAEGVWHTATGVINGASSVLNIDGVETTGTVTGVPGAGAFMGVNNPGASSVCSQTEAVIWNGYALTPAERAALQANQKAYWGTP